MSGVCEICGEPMPAGEEMFRYHGYSGDCPKPPLSPFVGKTASKLAKDAYTPFNEIPRTKPYVGQPPVHATVEKPPVVHMTFGANSSFIYTLDPRMIAINAAKYKFVAKMFEGMLAVLEIGCHDAPFTRIVAQAVPRVFATDYYKPHIDEARQHSESGRIAFVVSDFLDGDEWTGRNFEGAYCLDVLEHIDPAQEDLFLRRVVECLDPNVGVFICGMPTLESQRFASAPNVKAHINCQDPNVITRTLRKHFRNVFSFGMNDEVVHTGFEAMRHYQLNLCTGPKFQ